MGAVIGLILFDPQRIFILVVLALCLLSGRALCVNWESRQRRIVMIHLMKSLAIGALLFCVGLPARASNPLEDAWLSIIQADFDKDCAVELLGVGQTLVGYTGFRSEQWFVSTCHGEFEYEVVYYPPSAFPGRATPYEVNLVASACGAQPDNSFKPTPLRCVV
jgi:hypothetical protein